jgi:hypothetical protein
MAQRRATDRDRERAAKTLRAGWMSGAVSTETFDFRLGLALGARWRSELRALVADLPAAADRLRRTLLRPQPAIEVSDATPLVVPAEATQLLLGRHRTCDVRYDDDTVSRRHAIVRRVATGLAVRDLGSTNGTWLNGVRIDAEVRIVDGDELHVGGLRLVVRDRSAAQRE